MLSDVKISDVFVDTGSYQHKSRGRQHMGVRFNKRCYRVALCVDDITTLLISQQTR